MGFVCHLHGIVLGGCCVDGFAGGAGFGRLLCALVWPLQACVTIVSNLISPMTNTIARGRVWEGDVLTKDMCVYVCLFVCGLLLR